MTKPNRPRRIRAALVRCDTHGYYYGALMAECDPLLIEKHNKIVHYYATDWYDPKRITLPVQRDFEIVKCWDADRGRAEQFSEAFLGVPRPCRTVEEMADGVDLAFIGDCDGGGGDHLQLAAPFLRRGVPTFVDKPFASTLADARAIIALAREHGAPLYNASILSEVVAADAFRRRFAEIGPKAADWRSLSQAAVAMRCDPADVPGVRLGVVKGVGGALSQENLGRRDALDTIESRLAYIIHGIALAINVFGRGVEWVEAMGVMPLEFLRLHLRNGRDVLILNPSVEVFPERCSFYVEAYSKMGALHSGPIGDPEFLRGAARIVAKIARLARSRRPPRPYRDILEQIAVVEAGRIAQRDGRRVFVSDVLRGKVRL
jgi:hypothetical protein